MEGYCLISKALQEAIDHLKIQDVYVSSMICRHADDADPKYTDYSVFEIQLKHHVSKSSVVELEDGDQIMRVKVDLGVRWVEEDSEDKGGREIITEKALVEASFIAEYGIKKSLDKKSLDEFALKNVSFHVWPYWRELLATTCARMELPKVVLPTVQFAKNGSSSRMKKAQKPTTH
jgi:hypothetical protein